MSEQTKPEELARKIGAAIRAEFPLTAFPTALERRIFTVLREDERDDGLIRVSSEDENGE